MVDGRNYKAHRLAWLWCHGPIPEGLEVDHKDSNPANNAISNLRLATSQQQKANTKSRKPGHPKGGATGTRNGRPGSTSMAARGLWERSSGWRMPKQHGPVPRRSITVSSHIRDALPPSPRQAHSTTARRF